MKFPLLVILGLSLLAAPACSSRAKSGTGITQQELSSLLQREPNDTPDDYVKTYPRYRLIGVQPGDGRNGFATIVDMDSYESRNVALQELLSRSVQLTGIGSGSARFYSSTDGAYHMQVGDELAKLQILHKFDQAVRYLGRHEYQVDASIMARILQVHGVGATGNLITLPNTTTTAVQLTSVDPDSALGRVGLQTDDLVFSFQGNPIGPGDLGAVAQAFTAPSGTALDLFVNHNGVAVDQVYAVQ